jgi:hypothetical protein
MCSRIRSTPRAIAVAMTVRSHSLGVCLAIAMSTSAAHAQVVDSPATRAALVNAVVHRRLDLFGSDEKIDPCKVAQFLGDSAALSLLEPSVVSLFSTRRPFPCGPWELQIPNFLLTFDSVGVKGSTNREVHLLVIRGSAAHGEIVSVGLSNGRWTAWEFRTHNYFTIDRPPTRMIPPPLDTTASKKQSNHIR